MVQPWVNTRPHTAYLYPTLLCNLKCEMCYSGSHQNKELIRDELSIEDYRRLIPELYDVGVRTFDISGGEPFLSKDIWEIIRLIKSYSDTAVVVVNNGTRLRAILSILKKHMQVIDRIYVSIDSPIANEHNKIRGHHRAFQEALAGLSALHEAGYHSLGANMVIMSQNQHRIHEFLDFAINNRIKYVNLLRLIDVKESGPTQEDSPDKALLESLYLSVLKWIQDQSGDLGQHTLEIKLVLPGGFYNAYRNFPKHRKGLGGITFNVEFDPIRGCPAYGNSIIISSTGEISGCTAFVTQPSFYTGNIKTTSIANAISSWADRREKLRERERFLKEREPCKNCEHWNNCRGGCPATAYKYYGTIMKSDPTCVKALEVGSIPHERLNGAMGDVT